MNIYLGNYSIADMENRLGIKFPDELVEYMKGKRQANAGKLAKNTWHCFDIPFVLKCENIEMAKIINGYLAPLSGEMKDRLQIAIEGKP